MLAKRLIYNTSSSEELEANIISRLKVNLYTFCVFILFLFFFKKEMKYAFCND